MTINSLRDTRQNTITSKNAYEISIGTPLKPLHEIYSSNIRLEGTVDTRELIINGYVFNKDHLLIPGEEVEDKSFAGINASNIQVENDITADRFLGSGNYLDLTRLQNSVFPGKANIDIGGAGRRFNEIHANNVNAVTFAGSFIGDGSLLANLPIEETDYDNFEYNLIPNVNENIDIGTDFRRFRNVFARNFISSGKVETKELRITNQTFPEDLEQIITIANEYVRNLEYDISEDIMLKMGNIDLQINTSITGISYTVESTIKHAVIQNTIYPEVTAEVFIGSPSNIFREIHVITPFIYGTFNTCNISTDNIEVRRIEASNFVGNGEFIDDITHFGFLTSNVEPLYDKQIDIGNEDLRFRTMFTETIDAKKINLDGMDLRQDIRGVIVLNTENIYLNFSPFIFKNHTIDKITESVNNSTGTFHVSISGLYIISLFGLTSNRSQTLDNEIVWYIFHYNRSIRRGTKIRIQGQKPYSLVLGKLDTITLSVDPLQNVPLKLNSGLFIVVCDVRMPEIEDYFDL